MFSFCSRLVKRRPVYFHIAQHGGATSVEAPEISISQGLRPRSRYQAIISGVIWSSMKADAVAQLQLALFQPLQPQQIGRGRLMQGIDGGVEVAVFLLQPGELGSEFALFFVGHDDVLT